MNQSRLPSIFFKSLNTFFTTTTTGARRSHPVPFSSSCQLFRSLSGHRIQPHSAIRVKVNLKVLRILSKGPVRNFWNGPYGPMDEGKRKLRITSTMYYLAALGVICVGASYAAVPLYRIFCASYSYGGTTSTHAKETDLSKIKRVKNRELAIKFFADKSSSMQWNFRPQQSEIIVTPGETALAFYRAENKTSLPVDGISSYNVIPFEAGQYFMKIQCFCFEEQRLNPGEMVELPVFFYIDPEFVNDPKMENVSVITLSYTFFESKEMPGFNILNWSPHANRDHADTSEKPNVISNPGSQPQSSPPFTSTTSNTLALSSKDLSVPTNLDLVGVSSVNVVR